MSKFTLYRIVIIFNTLRIPKLQLLLATGNSASSRMSIKYTLHFKKSSLYLFHTGNKKIINKYLCYVFDKFKNIIPLFLTYKLFFNLNFHFTCTYKIIVSAVKYKNCILKECLDWYIHLFSLVSICM